MKFMYDFYFAELIKIKFQEFKKVKIIKTISVIMILAFAGCAAGLLV